MRCIRRGGRGVGVGRSSRGGWVWGCGGERKKCCAPRKPKLGRKNNSDMIHYLVAPITPTVLYVCVYLSALSKFRFFYPSSSLHTSSTHSSSPFPSFSHLSPPRYVHAGQEPVDHAVKQRWLAQQAVGHGRHFDGRYWRRLFGGKTVGTSTPLTPALSTSCIVGELCGQHWQCGSGCARRRDGGGGSGRHCRSRRWRRSRIGKSWCSERYAWKNARVKTPEPEAVALACSSRLPVGRRQRRRGARLVESRD